MHASCNAKHVAGTLDSETGLKQGSVPGTSKDLDNSKAMELEVPPFHVKSHDKDHALTANAFVSNAMGTSKPDLPVFIEACAGCGILSHTVKARGFKTLPIDCARNRHQPRCKIFELDLSQPHAMDLIKRICLDVPVVCVHIALPCGTCSKARRIPLPDGSPGPAPLRDWGFLYGLSQCHGD